MNLRTELALNQSNWKIALPDGIMTIGSCFSDEIGTRLQEAKFNTLINPFGTVYNPLAIHKLIDMALQQETPRADGFCSREGIVLHHDFHSAFADDTQAGLEAKLKTQLQLVNQTLKSIRVLIITYGAAWAYEQKSNQQVVANCHKIPQQHFNKFLLTQKRILESFEKVEKLLRQVNPSIRIMVTVSPVRHLKDTLTLNSVSKATLRLACHTMTEAFPKVNYFPAYEIMLDDLRDYRFYEPDMIHPNTIATDYIWEKFCSTYFGIDVKDFLSRWSKIKSGLAHRAFNPSSESHQKFLKNILAELISISQLVDVGDEIKTIQAQVNN